MKFHKLKVQPDFELNRRDKYKVKFVRMISGVPCVVKIRKLKKMQNTASAEGNTYVIDFNAPTFREGNTFWFIYDIERGQMTMEGSGLTVDATLANMVIQKHGIRQLVMATEKRKLADIIIYVILAIAVGIMAGFLIHLGITTGF